jgi:hypothetical protein
MSTADSRDSADSARFQHALAHAHSATWLLARLVAEIDGTSHLADELRCAVSVDGVRDPDRLRLSVLGVVRLANRAGCDAGRTLRLVRCFARAALAESHAPGIVEDVVRYCGQIVDTMHVAAVDRRGHGKPDRAA